MVGTIGSVGYGAGKPGGSQWRRLLLYYATGSLLGGALLGATMGAAALALNRLEAVGLPAAVVDVVGIAVLALMALRDLAGLPIPLPSRDRQVPMAWKRLPGYWSPFVYGFSLGTGFSTAIYLGSFYATLVIALLSRSFAWALALGIVYSLSRGLLIPISTKVNGGPDALVSRLAPKRRAVAMVSGALSATTTGLLLLTGALSR
jgi:hypothetical protein